MGNSPLLLVTYAVVCIVANLGSLTPVRGATSESATPKATGETVLYSFRGSPDGLDPVGALVAGAAGALYGTTPYGGSGCPTLGCGTVFKLTPSASGYNESILYSFRGGRDGSNPNGGLVVDKTGALYGTTLWGGMRGRGSGTGYGVVFKLMPSGTGYTESVIHVFSSGTDGANPYAGLMLDEKGALYGTTSAGGLNGGCFCGTVFKLTPSGTEYTESILHRFLGANDGYDPEAGLVADKAGALYGTTVWGGIGYGTVFKLTPSGTGYSESVLHRFRALRRGANPRAGLIVDRAGVLYGTTEHGGAYGERGSNYGDGTVFRLTPSPKGYVHDVLLNFRPREDGEFPEGNLIADKAGALYGTTCCYGAGGSGSVFKLTPSGTGDYTESVLYYFTGSKTGGAPYGGLIADKQGALYGTTSSGGGGCGGYGCGTVFKLTP